MKIRSAVAALSLVGLLALACCPANAQLTIYTDRTSWLTAVGGSVSFHEDFSGFTVDTQFRTAPVAANGFTLIQTGVDQVFRNEVDVNPQSFSDNNGTNNASTFVEGDGPTGVDIAMDSPVSAWGADFYGAASGEGLDLVVSLSGGGVFVIPVPGSPANTFTGFVADPGVSSSLVHLRARTSDGTTSGEGFGMDDVVGVNGVQAVPEPGAAVLLTSLALPAGLLFRRRAG